MALPHINGVPGTSIGAHCIAPLATENLTAGQVQSYLQEIENDIATIKSGNVTIAGNKTFSGATALTGGVTGGLVVSGGILKAPEFQFNSPLSVTRTGFSTPYQINGGAWAVTGGGQWMDGAIAGDVLYIPVDVPTGAVLNTVKVYIHPAGAHGGLPGNMPNIALTKTVIATDSSSTPAQTGGTDTSGTVGAYEAAHAITLTLTGGHTVNRATSAYHVSFIGEQGANALVNLIYVGIEYNYDVTEVGID